MPLDVKYEPWRVLPLKWVFAYSSLLSDYDPLLKAAVVSAHLKTSLLPICIFYGPINTVYHWLLKYKVVIIRHTPAWADLILSSSAVFKVVDHARMVYIFQLNE